MKETDVFIFSTFVTRSEVGHKAGSEHNICKKGRKNQFFLLNQYCVDFLLIKGDRQYIIDIQSAARIRSGFLSQIEMTA
jgi:hypothetical protein